MIPALQVSDAELIALGAELGGCNFGGPSCRRFIEHAGTCDVQAAPGSGKTTLLAAKLLLLNRRWDDASRGVCIISHTNAARREVEQRVAAAEAAQMLGHPHFIGTVTAFIHRFIAMPFLRGVGCGVSAVDDDVFAARARSMMWSYKVLRNQRSRNERNVIDWVTSLTVASTYVPQSTPAPERVPVEDRSGMPGPATETRAALEQIKAATLAEGIFRHADIAAIAARAIEACPMLATTLADRFPLIVVDEAQDTGGRHLALLEQVFGERASIQRLGDCNQTIYGEGPVQQGWKPREEWIDLGDSHRFGPEIAEFASKITVRREQTITGRRPGGFAPAVIAYDVGAEPLVLSKYAVLAAEACDRDDAIIWAVGSVHRPTGAASGLTLCDYHAPYRAPGAPGRAASVHAAFRDASLRAHRGEPLAEPVAACTRALIELLRRQKIAGFERRVAHRVLWRRLEEAARGASGRLRGVLVDWLASAPGDIEAWNPTRAALLAALVPLIGGGPLTVDATRYLEQAEPVVGAASRPDGAANHLDVDVAGRRIRIRLGSIASVKGETHDATLVLQTKRGSTSDVRTALKIAAKIDAIPTEANPYLLKAATNVFVAATRPRRLLCMAMPDTDLDARLRRSITEWGWRIVRCCA